MFLNSLFPPPQENTLLIVRCSAPLNSKDQYPFCNCLSFPHFSAFNSWERSCCIHWPQYFLTHLHTEVPVGERQELTCVTWLNVMRKDESLSPDWHMNQLCPDQLWSFMLNLALHLLRDDLPKFSKSPAETQLGQVWFFIFFSAWGCKAGRTHTLALHWKFWMKLGFPNAEKSLELWAQKYSASLHISLLNADS